MANEINFNRYRDPMTIMYLLNTFLGATTSGISLLRIILNDGPRKSRSYAQQLIRIFPLEKDFFYFSKGIIHGGLRLSQVDISYEQLFAK